jgi:hypothetical protein
MGHEIEKAMGFKTAFDSLYEGKSKIDLAAVGPYLFHLNTGSGLLEWFSSEGWGNSWGVFIHTPIPFQELYRHCRRFLLVRTEDQQELYFRFYDPRVLRIFLPTCSREQLKEFFGPITYFIVEDQDPLFANKYWLENYELKTLRFEVKSGNTGSFQEEISTRDERITNVFKSSDEEQPENNNAVEAAERARIPPVTVRKTSAKDPKKDQKWNKFFFD